jgi:streptomycin 6-kinase
VDSEFRRRIISFGEDGRRWLEELPLLLQRCEVRWRLQVGPPVADLSYNYVAPAHMADGRQIMLKLGVPRAELNREIMALRTYGGRGSVRLVDADAGDGVLLLEKLSPGNMLSEFGRENDAEATRIAARVMKRLWRPVPVDHQFKTIGQWAMGFKRLRDRFQGETGPFHPDLVAEAEAIFRRHLASGEAAVLLHGDLHHYNILAAEREPWLAIDPKGIVGDPAYDAGALLRNPIYSIYEWPDLAAVQSRRLDILAEELDFERRRLQDWAVAQVVLSAWWSFEEEGRTGEEWIKLAESIRAA